MSGWTLAAAASIAAGLTLGAAATVGVTLAVEHHDMMPAPGASLHSGPYQVQYGDRCFHGHCLPCDSKESCLNKLPPELRP